METFLWIATYAATKAPMLTLTFKEDHRLQTPSSACQLSPLDVKLLCHGQTPLDRLCLWFSQLMTLGVLHCELGGGRSVHSHFGVKNQQSPFKKLRIKVLVCARRCTCVCVFSIAPGIYSKGSLYQTCGTFTHEILISSSDCWSDWYSPVAPLVFARSVVYSQAVFNTADMYFK